MTLCFPFLERIMQIICTLLCSKKLETAYKNKFNNINKQI